MNKPQPQTPDQKARAFVRELPNVLPGTSNAGTRLCLRKSAASWLADPMGRTLRQAIEITASQIALYASGRFAVNSALLRAGE
jgi:hypothetical protein